MSAYKIIDQALKTAGEFYIELLQTELIFQEHIASGKLSQSFKPVVSERGGNLYMEVVNDVNYMWIVNNGKTQVYTDFDTIKAWSESGGKNLDFSDRRIKKIVKELKKNYYTKGGLLVAPRRTGFIDYAFGIADSMGINQMIEQDILKQVDAVIGEEGQSKAIQLTIS